MQNLNQMNNTGLPSQNKKNIEFCQKCQSLIQIKVKKTPLPPYQFYFECKNCASTYEIQNEILFSQNQTLN